MVKNFWGSEGLNLIFAEIPQGNNSGVPLFPKGGWIFVIDVHLRQGVVYFGLRYPNVFRGFVCVEKVFFEFC